MQGDIVAILDANGNTVVEYTYDIWGELVSITGSLADTIGAINPLRYRGYYYDTETGLYYLQSRYYSPNLMRFISQDDVKLSNDQGEPLGSNLYAYCLNNPVMNSDPTGCYCEVEASDITHYQLDVLARYIDEYIREQKQSLLNCLFNGLGNVLGVVLRGKIGVAYSYISLVSGWIPKALDELASIRYILDKNRFNFPNKNKNKHTFTLSMLSGTHHLQFRIIVYRNGKKISSTVFRHRNHLLNILSPLWKKANIPYVVYNVAWKYHY